MSLVVLATTGDCPDVSSRSRLVACLVAVLEPFGAVLEDVQSNCDLAVVFSAVASGGSHAMQTPRQKGDALDMNGATAQDAQTTV